MPLVLNNFPEYRPYTNVQPFTVRDGATYLLQLEALKDWLRDYVIPHLNSEVNGLAESWVTQTTQLIEAFEATVTQLTQLVEEATTDMTGQVEAAQAAQAAAEAAAALAEQFASDVEEIQDTAVTAIFNDAESAFRQAADAVYLTATDIEDLATEESVTALDGRVTTLETDIGTKVDQSVYDAQIIEYDTRFNRLVKHVKDFGAVGDGTTDDTTAILTAINASVPLYWGGPDDNYRITNQLQRTLTKPLVWRSDGAKITVDSAVSIRRAIDIDVNGHNVTIEGPLTVDANNKAFTAWYFNNNADFVNFIGVDMVAKNVFRADQTMAGGDGIHVRGAFTTVNIVRPDVRNIVMAEGAGVIGSQGVAGVTVSSAGPGLAPKEVTIDSPYIENVYSQDDSYTVDQDGIRVFTEEDSGSIILYETHFVVRGGKIKNCGGRGIKSQCEFGTVDGVMFIRRGTPFASRAGTMPEIDFQVGAGIITNCEFQYASSTPKRVVLWSGTRQVGGKIATGLMVTNCKVSFSGSQNLEQFFAGNMAEQMRATVVLQNIEVVNPNNFLTVCFASFNGRTDQELIIRLDNCSAPLNSGLPFFRRNAVAMPTFAGLSNLAQYRPGNAAFSELTTAGNYTQVTSGSNVRVV